MPLSPKGLCERRDHGGRDAPICGQPREAGSRDDPGVDDVDALGRDARGQRGLEHGPGTTGVASAEER